MKSNVTFLYVSENSEDGKTIQKTQEINSSIGPVSLDNVSLQITKISSNHVSFEIDDLTNETKAKFLVPKKILGKKVVLSLKSYNLQIGEWLDFTDGETDLRRSIYVKGIKNVN